MVRWGLLSTARINRALIPAIRASERGELTAVCSRSQESADAYAREWEIPLAFGSYKEMLDSDEVDAVYIGLPNHLHAEWSIKAMQAGKHVLCEKPFALSLAEVDEMIAVSQATGMRLTEAFMYRHHPQTKLVGEWVRNGRLGEIRAVRGVFNFKLTEPGNVRLVPEWGGGSLWDIGCYPMSFTQFVMGGPPEWVFGNQWVDESGVDMAFGGQMHYGNGRMGQFTCTFDSPFTTHIEIFGSEGRLAVNRPFVGVDGPDQKLLFYPVEGDVEEIEIAHKSLYLGEVEDMNAAILDGAPNYLALEETRNHVKTLLALYKSAAAGEVVFL